MPPEALDSLPLVGTSRSTSQGRVFTFPECDATGRVVGITERIPIKDGPDQKRNLRGGRRGLTVPRAWRERSGPVLLVEGPTDVMAAALCGLAVIGRFSNLGGVELLAELLKEWPADREIIVIGENDRKPDGRWPGRDGAERTAAELAGRLGRPVRWAMTPDGVKDTRAWIVDEACGAAESVDWQGIGRALLAALEPLPAPPLSDDRSRARIRVETVEHRVNDQAVDALGNDPDVFQRGGSLVRVTCDPPPASRAIRRPTGPRIELLTTATLRERLTRCADWYQLRKRGGDWVEEATHPPPWSVQAVHSRGQWRGVRVLEAVTEYPVVLPNGRILATQGYDPATGILCHPPPGLTLTVPAHPSRSEATAAARRILDAVSDFPFVGDADRSAWLAALLTPLARFAFSGPVPLFLAEGNCRGVGKGLLLDVIARVVTGQGFAVCPYTGDREEQRKLITSIVVQGDSMVLFDNLDGPFGGAVIDMALTGESWQARLLGTNTTARVPLFVTWYASGNNVALVGDTVRRVCPFRLETPLESPERRGDFRRPDLLRWVSEHRGELLSDALTVLRGWFAAGQPDQKLSPWGSFAGWSAVVRNAIVWCGLSDPAGTRSSLQERADTAVEAMREVLVGLEHLDPDRRGLTAAEIIDRVYGDGVGGGTPNLDRLRWALDELLPKRDARTLGYRLRSYRRRVVGGRYLDAPEAKSHGSARWAVYPEATFATRRDVATAG